MKFTKYSSLLVLLTSLSALGSIASQEVEIKQNFMEITTEDGISSSIVRAISQDSIGFLWIGTEDGLNRYDGYEFKVFRFDSEIEKSLPGNFILSLTPSSDGGMYIGTNNRGFAKYRPGTDDFVSYQHDENNINTIRNNSVTAIIEDRYHDLWIATNGGGISHYNTQTNTYTHYLHDKNTSNGIAGNFVLAMVQDKDGSIWFRTNEGIGGFNPETSEFSFVDLPGTVGAIENTENIIIDKDGVLWLGWNRELIKYNTRSKKLDKIGFNDLERKMEVISGLEMHDENHIWVATRGGLHLLNIQNYSLQSFYNNPIDRKSIPSTPSYTVYKDNTGNVWCSGLAKLIIQNQSIKHYYHISGDDNTIADNQIRALMTDRNENYWVALLNGLDIVNPNEGTVSHFEANASDTRAPLQQPPTCFFEDDNEDVWIGTWGNGIVIALGGSLDRVIKLEPEYGNASWLQNGFIMAIFKDVDEKYWIGTDKGLTVFDAEANEFRTFISDKDNPNSITPFGVQPNSIIQDVYNNIWVGTWGGLTKIKSLTPGKGALDAEYGFERFTMNAEGKRRVRDDRIISLQYNAELYPNYIFAGSFSEGIMAIKLGVSEEADSIFYVSRKTGLQNNLIYGLLFDKNNYLWASTNHGLSKIDISDFSVINFDANNGLQSNSFFWGAYAYGLNGNLLFGGVNGFNVFHPDDIDRDLHQPVLAITSLKIGNQEVLVGTRVNNRIILNRDINTIDEIELSHKEKSISFFFSGLHYAYPNKNLYQYKLEGFDKEWIETTSKSRVASYSNLKPGNYVFKIKASNYDGIWNEKGTSVKIVVTPPFWKTWWFITIDVLLFIALLLSFYYYRLLYISRRNNELEETVKVRTFEIHEKNEEIVAQNEELEKHRNNLETLVQDRTIKLEKALAKAKESDELKSAFLANMSHEIRTPMNAISGFSSILIEDDLTSEDRAEYIEIIQSNTNSLIKIIDEIIDLSLIESNQLKLINEVFDLNTMIDHLYSYYSLSNNKPDLIIRRNNTLQSQNLRLNSDSNRIKQIITNLMDNACKFADKGYVELGVVTENDLLSIYVEDTGRGISSNEIDHIFQEFTKIDEDELGWKQGIGLGLTISQKIAIALDAKISVESTKEKGSTFTFSIPLTKVLTQKEPKIKEFKQPAPISWEGKTILIAEDMEANFLYLKKALKKTQTNIIWAQNGVEAINLVTENTNIDLILMDIKMPIMNGYESAKKIKAYKPNQIIVAQTAYSRPNEREKFYDENFDEYLAKPINTIDLFMILEKYL